MTSMIDIVFLLIIFFMAVSQFNRTEDSQVQLAEIQNGGATAETSFIINVDAKQRLLIGGKAVAMSELIGRVSREVEQTGGKAEKLVVRIRCDRSQNSVRVNELMTQLSSIGITEIQLSVNKK